MVVVTSRVDLVFLARQIALKQRDREEDR